MKIKKKSIFIYIVVILIVLIVVTGFVLKNGDYHTYEVSKNDFVQVTEVSGKVIPAQELDFSFQITGRIRNIKVGVGDAVQAGDVLIQLDSSEVIGEIDEALASLRSEEAKLIEISGNGVTSQSRLDSLKSTLINTLKKGYVTADDVVHNSIDTFITDANTGTPDFDLSLGDYFLREEVEDTRMLIGKMLDDLSERVSIFTTQNISFSDVQVVTQNLSDVESLLALISSGVDEFDPTNNTSQSQIDAYISGISAGRTSVASIVVEISLAAEKLRDAEADVPLTQASIDSAEATINRLSAKSDKYTIRAPFNGIVTFSEVEIGQSVAAGEVILSMISDQALEVEAYIPEVNIAGVDVGDKATLTFDAFIGEEFDAFISHIDPRETIKDGITTYKILVEFSHFYNKIFSGMTNDILIEKERILNQITIPTRLIDRKEGNTYVQLLKGSKKEEVEIQIGISDGRGNTIVKSGLGVGDRVIEK